MKGFQLLRQLTVELQNKEQFALRYFYKLADASDIFYDQLAHSVIFYVSRFLSHIWNLSYCLITCMYA